MTDFSSLSPNNNFKYAKLPELLSPCGSPEALDAALEAGADAVYLGGNLFNARMNAKNFSDEAMLSAVEMSHEHGARIYVTLNTQLFDRELEDAVRYAASLWDIGVDALIIADLGLAHLLHTHLPKMELHASTQMTGHNAEAAQYLAGIGFSRMVCARETNFTDMQRLAHDSPIEIEAFIHGAHCVSVSGQCLFSAMVGGRSGNRGECAQPCRMPYNGGYPLSLRDMCLAPHVTRLIDSGVASLKIEGRMKSPDYVFAVTECYRRLLDERRNATPAEIEWLAKIFSRSGFTDGYFTGRLDTSMLGVRSDADKRATRFYHDGRQSASRRLEPIVFSREKAILPEKIQISRPTQPTAERPTAERPTAERQTEKFFLSAQFTSARQIPDSHNFDIVYLPLRLYNSKLADTVNGVALPPVIFDSEWNEVNAQLENAISCGIKHIEIENLGQFALAKSLAEKYPELHFHGGFRLNVFNSQTLAALDFLDDATVSPELILPQIRDLFPMKKKRVITYGRIPLMLLFRPVGAKTLKDRVNAEFPVLSAGRYDCLYNSIPTYMADRRDALRKAGIKLQHFIFSNETREEVVRIVEAYANGTASGKSIRRIK